MTSLAQQRQAIEHCLAMLRTYDRIDPTILEKAQAGCKTLAWLDKRQHLARALSELEKDAPGAAALAETFPDARVEFPRQRFDAIVNDLAEAAE